MPAQSGRQDAALYGRQGRLPLQDSASSAVFASTADPEYQKLLALCVAGKDFLAQNKRFDTPGFVPRTDWVREMKRYGVLPDGVKPAEVTDVYAVEREYWKSLWHQPRKGIDTASVKSR